MKNKILAYGICVLFIVLGWFYRSTFDLPSIEGAEEVLVKGVIIDVLSIPLEPSSELDELNGIMVDESYEVGLRITSGEFKNKLLTTVHQTSSDLYFGITVEPKDRVILSLDIVDGQLLDAHINDFDRAGYLWFLFIIFLLAIWFIGKSQGIKTIVSLMLTGVGIVYVLLPAILAGKNPIHVSILVCTGVTIITHMLITGFTRKSVAAISGTLFGIVIGGMLAQFVIYSAHITGLSSEESRMFYYNYGSGELDVRGLLFAGIIIGSLGAVMDVSMSIASAMLEIQNTDATIRSSTLMKKGMNVGRDIIGTMANTLILANTGTALPLMLLILSNKLPYLKYINLELIATEIIRSLTGSIGLFMAVPFTVIISAMLYKKSGRRPV